MLYQPGLLVGELSGKAGHNLASKNSYSTFITVDRRTRPSSSPQAQAARGSFSSIAKLFKTLTSGELAGWASLGSGLVVDGRLARQYTLTAQAAFSSINRNLAVTGQAYVTTAPAAVYPAPMNSFSAIAVAQPTGPYSIALTIDPATVPASTYFAIYGQAPRNTVASTAGLRTWKLLEVLSPAASTAIDVETQYRDRFATWWPGQTIPLKVVAISAEGFRGFALTTWVTST